MILEFFIIFFAKLIEVILTTTRVMIAGKGKKRFVPVIAFLEINMWLWVVSRIVVGISGYPYKMIAYALAFSIGHYVGLLVDEKLSLGKITIQVIISEKDGIKLTNCLREKEIAVTTIDGEGMHEKKKVLIIYAPRKRKEEIIKNINDETENALIIVSDIKSVIGGFRIGE